MRQIGFILFIFFSQNLCAQNFIRVEGKVFDRQTQQPIAGAYVGIQSKGTGTLTNADGVFLFKCPAINQREQLSITFLGYKNHVQGLDSASVAQTDTIWLDTQAPVILDTAYINHIDARNMVASALFRVKANANLEPYMMNGFYQETLWQDSLFIRIYEGLLKVEKNPTPPNKIPEDFMAEKVKLVKGRYYEKPDYTENLSDFGFGNGPAIVTHSMEISLPEYLDGRNFDDYVYTLDSLLSTHNDRPVFVFHFVPNPKRRLTAAREGEIFVDTLSRAIVRIEYGFTEEGMKDVVKGSLKGVFGKLKTDVKKVYGAYNYHLYRDKWYLQDAQLQLSAELKRGKDFQALADIRLQYVCNEIALRFAPPIKPEEVLENIDAFPSGGGRYEDNLWGNFNFIKPTALMKDIIKK
jgi:CarboxypepD_reg-like domain